MNHTSKLDSTPNLLQGTSYPKQHHPYTKMSQRRAIACTICAKAKTKCDKAVSSHSILVGAMFSASDSRFQVPSCSRCTAKGLPCEPRSTRRTSDSSYRNPKKHMVSPKRFPSTNSIPTIGRHNSPRSVPLSDRHQLVRAVSQMDFHTAVKLGQQRPDFAAVSMLAPLHTYTPQIIDECYSSSPEPNISVYSQHMDRSQFAPSGRLTPHTPEPFQYNEPVSFPDPFHQYNAHPWSNEVHEPIGLGFGNNIPGLMPNDAETRVWAPEFDTNTMQMGNMRAYDPSMTESPVTTNVWASSALSISPPQLPHTRAVPSLSISECSLQDSESPNPVQDEWTNFRSGSTDTPMAKPSTSYLDNIKVVPNGQHMWDDGALARMYMFPKRYRSFS